MEEFSKALQQPEYVHSILNHFPLIGLLTAALALLVALILRNRGATLIGLALVFVMALMVVPVVKTGEAGRDRVLSMTDDAGGDYLNYHEQLAERWKFLYLLTAAAAVVGWSLAWRWPRSLPWSGAVCLLFAFGSLGAGAVIAQAGGKIRHREFRLGPPPPATQSFREQSGIGCPGLPGAECVNQGARTKVIAAVAGSRSGNENQPGYFGAGAAHSPALTLMVFGLPSRTTPSLTLWPGFFLRTSLRSC